MKSNSCTCSEVRGKVVASRVTGTLARVCLHHHTVCVKELILHEEEWGRHDRLNPTRLPAARN